MLSLTSTLTLQVLHDMIYFFLIILAVIITSAFAFMLLEETTAQGGAHGVPDQFSSWGRSMFTTFGQV